jgi:hypothetical protein
MSIDKVGKEENWNTERTGGTDGTEGAGDGAELLELLALLVDPTRRRLLAYIAYDNPEDVEDIPTHTGATRHLDEGAVEGLLEALRQDHLPALESTGIIDWDRENDVVTRGERFDDLWPVLRLMIVHREELPDEWLSFADFEDLDEFGAVRDREAGTGAGEE